ncbi:MAG: hypothetical protein R6V04_00715 [bacterium]
MNIKNYLKYGLILILFCFHTLYATDSKEKEADVARLNHEIVLLNLINGLYLSNDQVESLIVKIEEAEKVKKNYYSQLNRNKTEFKNTLNNLKQVLLQDGEISERLKKQIHRMKKRQHELKDSKGEQLIRLQEEIKEILTPNQLTLIDEFKPCTIPPKTGRIGQSVESGSERLVQLLERIRNMSPSKYDMVKDMLADMLLEKIEKYIQKFSENEREEYRQKILKTYETARKLSDKEFLMQKSTLAQDIIPEHDSQFVLKKHQLDKIGRFFLDETALNILKEKFGK